MERRRGSQHQQSTVSGAGSFSSTTARRPRPIYVSYLLFTFFSLFLSVMRLSHLTFLGLGCVHLHPLHPLPIPPPISSHPASTCR